MRSNRPKWCFACFPSHLGNSKELAEGRSRVSKNVAACLGYTTASVSCSEVGGPHQHGSITAMRERTVLVNDRGRQEMEIRMSQAILIAVLLGAPQLVRASLIVVDNPTDSVPGGGTWITQTTKIPITG